MTRSGNSSPTRPDCCHGNVKWLTGHRSTPTTHLRALLDGYVQRVVVDANSVVIDMGRASRLFAGYARQAAMILVTRCDHPGCDLPAAVV